MAGRSYNRRFASRSSHDGCAGARECHPFAASFLLSKIRLARPRHAPVQ